jgi:negative regulator of sigma E activity
MKQTMTDSKNTEQNLQAAIAKLPQEMTPERDLWSGIEKAISQSTQTIALENNPKAKTFMPMAWAASVVAAVLLTWVTLGPTPDSGKQPLNLVVEMQQDFEQQKKTMLVSFGAPDVKKLPAAMQRELTKLSSAQQTISKALVDDPNNSDLLNLLRWTQKQELDLLKQLYSPQWQTI